VRNGDIGSSDRDSDGCDDKVAGDDNGSNGDMMVATKR